MNFLPSIMKQCHQPLEKEFGLKEKNQFMMKLTGFLMKILKKVESLYYQIPFFCNAKLFAKNQHANTLEEYQLIQDYHIPIARSIDEAPVLKLGMFNIIRQELLACQNRQMDMNKNG